MFISNNNFGWIAGQFDRNFDTQRVRPNKAAQNSDSPVIFLIIQSLIDLLSSAIKNFYNVWLTVNKKVRIRLNRINLNKVNWTAEGHTEETNVLPKNNESQMKWKQ